MKVMIKNIGKQALLFCLLVLPVAAFSALPASAAPVAGEVTLEAAQEFTVEEGVPVSDTFTYRMNAITPGAPMPAGSTEGVYRFSIRGNDTVFAGPIEFSQAGTYSYEIAQITDQRQEGCVYDEQVYRVTVYVDAGLHTNIVVRKSSGKKTSQIHFQNRFSLRPSDPSVKVDPPVKKTGTSGTGTAKTGDDTNLASWIMTMTGSAFTALCFAAFLIKRKQREELHVISREI